MTNDQPGTPEEQDAGEPIVELARLRIQPGRPLVERVHNSLDLRSVGANILEFSCLALLEFLGAILSIFLSDQDEKRKPGAKLP